MYFPKRSIFPIKQFRTDAPILRFRDDFSPSSTDPDFKFRISDFPINFSSLGRIVGDPQLKTQNSQPKTPHRLNLHTYRHFQTSPTKSPQLSHCKLITYVLSRPIVKAWGRRQQTIDIISALAKPRRSRGADNSSVTAFPWGGTNVGKADSDKRPPTETAEAAAKRNFRCRFQRRRPICGGGWGRRI